MPDFMQRRRLTRLLDRSAEQVEGLRAPEELDYGNAPGDRAAGRSDCQAQRGQP